MIITDGKVLAETVNIQVVTDTARYGSMPVVQHYLTEEVYSLIDTLMGRAPWSRLISSDDDRRVLELCRTYVEDQIKELQNQTKPTANTRTIRRSPSWTILSGED
jgi:hypothetical protein